MGIPTNRRDRPTPNPNTKRTIRNSIGHLARLHRPMSSILRRAVRPQSASMCTFSRGHYRPLRLNQRPQPTRPIDQVPSPSLH